MTASELVVATESSEAAGVAGVVSAAGGVLVVSTTGAEGDGVVSTAARVEAGAWTGTSTTGGLTSRTWPGLQQPGCPTIGATGSATGGAAGGATGGGVGHDRRGDRGEGPGLAEVEVDLHVLVADVHPLGADHPVALAGRDRVMPGVRATW